MAKAGSVAGIVDARSSGVLRDYVHSHEPCAPGAAAHARRRMYEYNSLLKNNNQGLQGSYYPGCTDLLAGYRATYAGGYGGSFGGAYGKSPGVYGGGGGPNSPYGGTAGLTRGGNGMAPSEFMPNEQEEDYSKFDQPKDWLTCFGAVVIVACVLGLVHSFAVFAPSMQHHYETGLIETVLVGCLCYTIMIMLIPLSTLILACLEHRWTALFGMLLIFNGLLLDAFTLCVASFWVSHLLFIGPGCSLAYEAAVSICSDHFRKHLGYALCAVSCAGSLGTIIIYFLSNLMLSYISYLWTKLCLALLFLICMGACQTFPERSQHFPWSTDRSNKDKVKECLQEYARARNEKTRKCQAEEDAHRKSLLCVCVCDVSVLTDFSFLLWAVLNLLAVLAIYVPYLFLEAYAVMLGTDYAISLIMWFCLASILARIAVMNSNDHTFGFNRTVFQVCCIGSGILYIFLNWAETYGWILVWGLAMGALEGILTSCIPRVTLQTVPLKWLSACWTWTVLFHAIGLLIGPVLMLSVYYYVLEYGPALIAIGITQIIAGLLAFLLPNEENEQLLEVGGENKMDTGKVNPSLGAGKGSSPWTDGSGGGSKAGYGSGGSGNAGYSGGNNYGSGTGVGNTYAGGYSGTGNSMGIKSTSPDAKNDDTELALPLGANSSAIQSCFDRPYTDDCPICSKIGCVPGCCDCTPAGLTRTHTYGSSTVGNPLPYSYNVGGYSTNNYSLSASPGYGCCKAFIADLDSYLNQLKNPQVPMKPASTDTRKNSLTTKDGATDKKLGKSESKDKENRKGTPKKLDQKDKKNSSDQKKSSSKDNDKKKTSSEDKENTSKEKKKTSKEKN